ncbi:MAG: hypothetical protein Q4D55_02945 [Eubacteriales bacterium]|nr:hypothetical protein [Eubacteriales bacterium]
MKQGQKQTFLIEVEDTQNMSWQGRVEWIQGGKRRCFRSVMELLRLMDSVVEDGEKTKEESLEDQTG